MHVDGGFFSQGPAEPETARVYQEFLKTFQPEDPSADKTFIRGEGSLLPARSVMPPLKLT